MKFHTKHGIFKWSIEPDFLILTIYGQNFKNFGLYQNSFNFDYISMKVNQMY